MCRVARAPPCQFQRQLRAPTRTTFIVNANTHFLRGFLFIHTVAIFQVWRYAITIHIFGPLQVDLSSIHAIFYICRVHSQLAGAYAYRDTRIGPLSTSRSGCAHPRRCAHEECGHARLQWLAREAERLRSPMVACIGGAVVACTVRRAAALTCGGHHVRRSGCACPRRPAREAEQWCSHAPACLELDQELTAAAGLGPAATVELGSSRMILQDLCSTSTSRHLTSGSARTCGSERSHPWMRTKGEGRMGYGQTRAHRRTGTISGEVYIGGEAGRGTPAGMGERAGRTISEHRVQAGCPPRRS
jgi:hypothetical protein